MTIIKIDLQNTVLSAMNAEPVRTERERERERERDQLSIGKRKRLV